MTAAYYKYLIGHFLSPISLLIFIIAISYLLILLNKNIRFAKISGSLAIVFLYFFSTKLGSDIVLAPLEFKYPKFVQSAKPIDNIIVLGCANEFSAHLPESSKLHGCSHIRLQEGLNIHKLNPNSRLILTGGDKNAKDTIAQAMQRTAINMGVEPNSITVLTNSINTEDEAAQSAMLVVDSQTVLVTSAAHMRRAMKLFANHGITPIPAPTDFLIRELSDTWHLRYFIPEVANLEKVRSAFHEYYGQVWLMTKSLIIDD